MIGLCRRSMINLLLFFASLGFRNVDKVDASTTAAVTEFERIIKSQAVFGSKFYEEFVNSVGRRRNVVVSPLSVYMVLAMLRHGAAKNSRFQIEQAMALPKGGDFGAGMKFHADFFAQDNKTMNIVNKIWQQTFFCFTQCRKFTRDLQKNFYADLGEVNFAVNPKEAARLINRWVHVQSRGRIKELVNENEVSKDTRFVFTNVIYFKAQWTKMFRKTATKKREFIVVRESGEMKKHVDTMFTYDTFRYTSGFDVDFLELPYRNAATSMIIAVPRSIKAMDKFEKSLNFTTLDLVIEGLQFEGSIEVFMPKFCISTGTALNGVLKAMGVQDIFDPTLADLRNILGFKGMYVSSVRHEAFIKVTEEGTEASGGSSASSGDLSIPFQFRVNRPFMFFIRHAVTGSIVFMGRVDDPSVQNC